MAEKTPFLNGDRGRRPRPSWRYLLALAILALLAGGIYALESQESARLGTYARLVDLAAWQRSLALKAVLAAHDLIAGASSDARADARDRLMLAIDEMAMVRDRLSATAPLPAEAAVALGGFLDRARALAETPDPPTDASQSDYQRVVADGAGPVVAAFDRLVGRFQSEARDAAERLGDIELAALAASLAALVLVGLLLLRPLAIRARAALAAAQALQALPAPAPQPKVSDRRQGEFLVDLEQAMTGAVKSVVGLSDVLVLGAAGPLSERQSDFARRIRESAQKLALMLEDVRELALIDAGRLALDERPVDLKETVIAVLRTLKGVAEERNLSLMHSLPVDAPRLRADPARLRQMLLKLLHNAMRYSPQGASIHVRVAIAGHGGMTMAVEDAGVGIAQEDIPRALARLGRLGEPQIASGGASGGRLNGAGLGLPLAKELVELHGGSLTLASQPGKGTTATLSFPAERTLRGPAGASAQPAAAAGSAD
ncbi:MAG: HAMP domain-containing histidine kinase [Proteobacteria bacterium]|nr:HAMP domain-containing histidine kinase [Pseudomonadota bacterium]MBI3498480.1 HAMP domain-containing histidine kinase [Pseudomonadota bacterium]